MSKLLKKAKNQKGFTLAELMVVVVIIGVLVAIAIPVYSGVQATARKNACWANQRTIDGAVAIAITETGNWEDWKNYVTEEPGCPDDGDPYEVTADGANGCPNDHGSYKD